MAAEYKRLLSDVRDQYTDARDWNLRYKASFKDIHCMELGALITAMHKPLELGREGCCSIGKGWSTKSVTKWVKGGSLTKYIHW